MRVTVIATGFDQKPAEEVKTEETAKASDNTDIDDIFSIFKR